LARGSFLLARGSIAGNVRPIDPQRAEKTSKNKNIQRLENRDGASNAPPGVSAGFIVIVSQKGQYCGKATAESHWPEGFCEPSPAQR